MRSDQTTFLAVIGAIVAVAALAVVIASLRMTDRAIERAVRQREAASLFLAEELSVLRATAMTSHTPVAGRLYLGIEECFRRTVAVPFNREHLAEARRLVQTCAEMELGRLYAQRGAAMAEEGQRTLRQTGLLR